MIKNIFKNKDFKNIFFSIISYLIFPIITFFSTPILINNLGIDSFGIWMLLNSLISILSISNMGIGNTIIKFGAEYIARSEYQQFVKLISLANFITIIIGLFLSCIFFFTAEYIAELFFKLETSVIEDIWAFKLIGVIVSVKIITSIYSSTIMAYERYDIINKVNILMNSSLSIGSIILVNLEYQLNDLIIFLAIISAISFFIFYFAAKKQLSAISLIAKYDNNLFKSSLSFSIQSWIQSIVNVVYSQTDKILLTIFLGPVALGYYTACMQLASKIHEIPVTASAYLYPKFSNLKAANENNRLKVIYNNAFTIKIIFITILGILVFLFADPILKIWIGEDFAKEAKTVLRILSFAFFALGLGIIPYYFLNAIGYIKLNTKLGIISSVLTITFTLILTPTIGVFGAAFARFVSFPMACISIYIIYKKILKIRRVYVFKQLIIPLLLFLITHIYIIIFGEVQINSWLVLLIAVTFMFLLLLIILILIYLLLGELSFLKTFIITFGNKIKLFKRNQ